MGIIRVVTGVLLVLAHAPQRALEPITYSWTDDVRHRDVVVHIWHPVSPARQLPVVLFSPGAGTRSSVYTAKIEDLASHGYVVVAVDYPAYGPPPACQPRANATYDEAVSVGMSCMRDRADVDAKDLQFVLDRVIALNGPFDLARVAAVGHSLGGFVSVRACQLDQRITVCVNEDGGTADGAFLQYVDAAPPKQPVLYVEASVPAMTDQQLAASGLTRDEWDRRLKHVLNDVHGEQLRGSGRGSYKVSLHAPGMQHSSFGDAFKTAATPEASRAALHNLALTEDVTRAFLDKHLKADPKTILDDGVERSEIVVTPFNR